MAVEKVSRPLSIAQYIGERLESPFIWGSNDCVTFVSEWVKLRTGIDHKIALKPWASEAEAVIAIKACGGIQAYCDKSFRKINPLMASDGDIALIGRTLYLFSGINIVAPGPNGLVFEDRMKASCAWSY